jgi:hypothetical protein
MAEAMHERCKDAVKLKPASPVERSHLHHDMVDDGA